MSNSMEHDAQFRTRLAAWILIVGCVGVVVLSIVTITTAAPVERADMARMVFTAALPLLGTWVGTVLAFYFAKGNLEAATDSVARISGMKPRTTPVTGAMIRRNEFVAKVLGDGQTGADVKLGELRRLMTDTGKGRIPILSATDVVKWVVHESLIIEYASTLAFAITDDRFKSKTLADLIEADPRYDNLAVAFSFVAASANLGAARDAMASVPSCNDVFVTQTGRATDPVIGWLTNTLLATVDDSST